MSQKLYKGIVFTVGEFCKVKDGRVSTRVSTEKKFLYENISKKETVTKKTIDKKIKATSEKELESKVHAWIEQVYEDNKNLLMDRILSGEINDVSLAVYYYLRQNDIVKRNHWARRKAEYEEIAESVVIPIFGDLLVRGNKKMAVLKKENVEERMESKYHRKRRKTTYSEEECKCWILIDAIMQEAVTVDHICETNPFRDVAKTCKTEWERQANLGLARRSFSEKELTELLAICLGEDGTQIKEDCAIVVCMCLLIKVSEVCALNLADFKFKNLGFFLEITKECIQRKNGPVVVTGLLLDDHQYRRVACSDEMQIIIAQQLRTRMKAGAKEEDPLFVDEEGNRLTPQRLKNRIKELAEKVMRDGVHREPGARGARFKDRDINVFFGDLLRATGEYYLRTYSRMTDDMSSAVRGVARKHTYGIYYTDWWNDAVMLTTKEKMEIWHRDFLYFNSETGQIAVRKTLRGACERFFIRGVAKRGAEIYIDAPNGVALTVQ